MTQIGNISYSAAKFAERYSDSSLNTSACPSCLKNLLQQTFSPVSKLILHCFCFHI